MQVVRKQILWNLRKKTIQKSMLSKLRIKKQRKEFFRLKSVVNSKKKFIFTQSGKKINFYSHSSNCLTQLTALLKTEQLVFFDDLKKVWNLF